MRNLTFGRDMFLIIFNNNRGKLMIQEELLISALDNFALISYRRKGYGQDEDNGVSYHILCLWPGRVLCYSTPHS